MKIKPPRSRVARLATQFSLNGGGNGRCWPSPWRDLAQDRSNRVHPPVHGILRQEPLLESRWQIERMGDNIREQSQRNGLVQELGQIGIKFSLALEKLAKEPDQFARAGSSGSAAC